MGCSSRCWSLLFCLMGMGLSGVAYYVEHMIDTDPEYKPFCDLDEHMSCSKVFKSQWATGFGVMTYLVDKEHWLNQPNPIYGFFIYPFIGLLSLLNFQFFVRIQTFIAFLLNLGSVYLGYILYFILKDICVVCISLYAVNFFLLITSYIQLRGLKKAGQLQKQRQRENSLHLPTTSNPMDFKKNI